MLTVVINIFSLHVLIRIPTQKSESPAMEDNFGIFLRPRNRLRKGWLCCFNQFFSDCISRCPYRTNSGANCALLDFLMKMSNLTFCSIQPRMLAKRCRSAWLVGRSSIHRLQMPAGAGRTFEHYIHWSQRTPNIVWVNLWLPHSSDTCLHCVGVMGLHPS